MSDDRCPWKIRWTFGTDAQCEKPLHLHGRDIETRADGRFRVYTIGDPQHSARVGPSKTTELTWQAGDRREYMGEYPGPCMHLAACTLHRGHHGRCAP